MSRGNPKSLTSFSETTVRPRFRKKGFTTNVWEDPAGKRWPSHVHEVDEIVLSAVGQIEVVVGNKRIRPLSGRVVVIPAHTLHSIRNLSRVRKARYFFGFKKRK